MDENADKMSETVNCSRISAGVPNISLRNSLNSAGMNHYALEDETVLDPRSSIESNLSVPPEEPSVLEELRTNLEKRLPIFRRVKVPKHVKLDESLFSSPGSQENSQQNAEDTLKIAPKSRKLQLYNRGRKTDVRVNFTFGNDSSSSIDNSRLDNTSMDVSRTDNVNPLFRRPQFKRKSVKLDLSMSDDSKHSINNESLTAPANSTFTMRRATRASALKPRSGRINKNVTVDLSVGSLESSVGEPSAEASVLRDYAESNEDISVGNLIGSDGLPCVGKGRDSTRLPVIPQEDENDSLHSQSLGVSYTEKIEVNSPICTPIDEAMDDGVGKRQNVKPAEAADMQPVIPSKSSPLSSQGRDSMANNDQTKLAVQSMEVDGVNISNREANDLERTVRDTSAITVDFTVSDTLSEDVTRKGANPLHKRKLRDRKISVPLTPKDCTSTAEEAIQDELGVSDFKGNILNEAVEDDDGEPHNVKPAEAADMPPAIPSKSSPLSSQGRDSMANNDQTKLTVQSMEVDDVNTSNRDANDLERNVHDTSAITVDFTMSDTLSEDVTRKGANPLHKRKLQDRKISVPLTPKDCTSTAEEAIQDELGISDSKGNISSEAVVDDDGESQNKKPTEAGDMSPVIENKTSPLPLSLDHVSMADNDLGKSSAQMMEIGEVNTSRNVSNREANGLEIAAQDSSNITVDFTVSDTLSEGIGESSKVTRKAANPLHKRKLRDRKISVPLTPKDTSSAEEPIQNEFEIPDTEGNILNERVEDVVRKPNNVKPAEAAGMSHVIENKTSPLTLSQGHDSMVNDDLSKLSVEIMEMNEANTSCNISNREANGLGKTGQDTPNFTVDFTVSDTLSENVRESLKVTGKATNPLHKRKLRDRKISVPLTPNNSRSTAEDAIRDKLVAPDTKGKIDEDSKINMPGSKGNSSSHEIPNDMRICENPISYPASEMGDDEIIGNGMVESSNDKEASSTLSKRPSMPNFTLDFTLSDTLTKDIDDCSKMTGKGFNLRKRKLRDRKISVPLAPNDCTSVPEEANQNELGVRDNKIICREVDELNRLASKRNSSHHVIPNDKEACEKPISVPTTAPVGDDGGFSKEAVESSNDLLDDKSEDPKMKFDNSVEELYKSRRVLAEIDSSSQALNSVQKNIIKSKDILDESSKYSPKTPAMKINPLRNNRKTKVSMNFTLSTTDTASDMTVCDPSNSKKFANPLSRKVRSNKISVPFPSIDETCVGEDANAPSLVVDEAGDADLTSSKTSRKLSAVGQSSISVTLVQSCNAPPSESLKGGPQLSPAISLKDDQFKMTLLNDCPVADEIAAEQGNKSLPSNSSPTLNNNEVPVSTDIDSLHQNELCCVDNVPAEEVIEQNLPNPKHVNSELISSDVVSPKIAVDQVNCLRKTRKLDKKLSLNFTLNNISNESNDVTESIGASPRSSMRLTNPLRRGSLRKPKISIPFRTSELSNTDSSNMSLRVDDRDLMEEGEVEASFVSACSSPSQLDHSMKFYTPSSKHGSQTPPMAHENSKAIDSPSRTFTPPRNVKDTEEDHDLEHSSNNDGLSIMHSRENNELLSTSSCPDFRIELKNKTRLESLDSNDMDYEGVSIETSLQDADDKSTKACLDEAEISYNTSALLVQDRSVDEGCSSLKKLSNVSHQAPAISEVCLDDHKSDPSSHSTGNMVDGKSEMSYDKETTYRVDSNCPQTSPDKLPGLKKKLLETKDISVDLTLSDTPSSNEPEGISCQTNSLKIAANHPNVLMENQRIDTANFDPSLAETPISYGDTKYSNPLRPMKPKNEKISVSFTLNGDECEAEGDSAVVPKPLCNKETLDKLPKLVTEEKSTVDQHTTLHIGKTAALSTCDKAVHNVEVEKCQDDMVDNAEALRPICAGESVPVGDSVHNNNQGSLTSKDKTAAPQISEILAVPAHGDKVAVDVSAAQSLNADVSPRIGEDKAGLPPEDKVILDKSIPQSLDSDVPSRTIEDQSYPVHGDEVAEDKIIPQTLNTDVPPTSSKGQAAPSQLDVVPHSSIIDVPSRTNEDQVANSADNVAVDIPQSLNLNFPSAASKDMAVPPSGDMLTVDTPIPLSGHHAAHSHGGQDGADQVAVGMPVPQSSDSDVPPSTSEAKTVPLSGVRVTMDTPISQTLSAAAPSKTSEDQPVPRPAVNVHIPEPSKIDLSTKMTENQVAPLCGDKIDLSTKMTENQVALLCGDKVAVEATIPETLNMDALSKIGEGQTAPAPENKDTGPKTITQSVGTELSSRMSKDAQINRNSDPIPNIKDSEELKTPSQNLAKPKRKSVSFKPSTQNLYHSPPDVHYSDEMMSQNNSAVSTNAQGYEFSQIQMTSEISEIHTSRRVTRSKKHFSSTPLPKSKKRRLSPERSSPKQMGLEPMEVPVPSTSKKTDHEFLVPPPPIFANKLDVDKPLSELLSPRTHVEPLEPSPKESQPNRASGTESGSEDSAKTTLDISCENYLNISAIPKEQVGPRWGNVFHSTPLHRTKTSTRKSKRKDTSATQSKSLRERESVNSPAQTSRKLRSSSLQESRKNAETSVSRKEDSKLKRNDKSSVTLADSQSKSHRANDSAPGSSTSVNDSSPSRISIKDNTVLSSRLESLSRPRRDFPSSRSSRVSQFTRGSSYTQSYDSHRTLHGRRLFSDEVIAKADDDDKSKPATESDRIESGSQPEASAQDDVNEDNASLPSLPPSESRDESFRSSSTGSIAPYIVPPESFRNQVDSIRRFTRASSVNSDGSEASQSRRDENSRRVNEIETKRPRSKFSKQTTKPPSELSLIFPKTKRPRRNAIAAASTSDQSLEEWAKKPRKLFKPDTWASKSMYDWLQDKLEDKHGLNTSSLAEKIVVDLHHATVMVKSGHTENCLEPLFNRVIELELFSSTLELWSFINRFMPLDFKVATLPMCGALDSKVKDSSLFDDSLVID